MFYLNGFNQKFRPNISEIGVAHRKFKFYTPSDLELLLDDDVSTENFPLWARIWEPSLVLGFHMSTIQPDLDKACLEIVAVPGPKLYVVIYCAGQYGAWGS